MVKQKKEIGHTLRKDAGERLKKAVEEKDFSNIVQAQSMLEAALKARPEERERANDAESVELFVLKKKSELIDRHSKSRRSMRLIMLSVILPVIITLTHERQSYGSFLFVNI